MIYLASLHFFWSIEIIYLIVLLNRRKVRMSKCMLSRLCALVSAVVTAFPLEVSKEVGWHQWIGKKEVSTII